MNKIQGTHLVFGVSVVISLMLSALDSYGGNTSQQLKHADSLFKAKKYTESFEVYDAVLDEGEYTPSMLLKMAFIKEGLGDVSGALFFLNQYYNQTSNKTVLVKLEEIARDNQLIGYDFGDFDFVLNMYNRYRLQILMFMAVISLTLFGTVLYQKKKTGDQPVGSGIACIISLCLLFYLLNFGFGQSKGIIIDPQTYLMTGPSGGADVIGIIEKGHRVDILGKKGVWIKIKWENQEVYIRGSKIRSLS